MDTRVPLWSHPPKNLVFRNLLGRYLLRDPRSLRFQYNPYGKPTLAKEGSGDNDVLSF